MIGAILIDVGGVFAMPAHDVVSGVCTAHGGIEPGSEALVSAHYLGVAAAEEQPDGFDWQAYRRALLVAGEVPESRIPVADVELNAALGGPASQVWIEPLPGAVQGYHRLEALGIPLAIVSNSDGTVAQVLAGMGVGPAGADRPLRLVVDSALVGLEKPDPGIFRFALDQLGVAAGDAVHVGDTVTSDVVGATAAGIRALHLDPIGWCRDRTHPHVGSLSEVADLVAKEDGPAT